MKFTLIDHDKLSLFKEDTYGNRAILQFEDHAAAQAAFAILEKKLTPESNRIQYILGRSIVINKLSDAQYEKMLDVLKQADEQC